MNIAAANQRRFKVNMKAPDAQYVWPFYPLPPAWKLLNPYWESRQAKSGALVRGGYRRSIGLKRWYTGQTNLSIGKFCPAERQNEQRRSPAQGSANAVTVSISSSSRPTERRWPALPEAMTTYCLPSRPR